MPAERKVLEGSCTMDSSRVAFIDETWLLRYFRSLA